MTIAAVVPAIKFAGSSGAGTSGPFSLVKSGTPINFSSNSHIKVYRYDTTSDAAPVLLVEDTDYTLTGGPDAGSITLTAPQTALLAAERLLVYREQPTTQALNLTNGSNFSGPALEARFDRVVEMIQELGEKVGRAVKATAFGVDAIPDFNLAASLEKIAYLTGTEAAPVWAYHEFNAADIAAIADALDDLAIIAADLTGADTIGLVAAIDDAVAAVAAIAADVTTVANNIDDVVDVASAIANGDVSRVELTYAALTAITAASRFDNMLVYVQSRATDGDGGHGWWRFDAASSATANGGTILAPDAGTGRWLRLYNLPADVRWFGVKCDGVTNDATALSTALNTTAIPWFFIPSDTLIESAVVIARDNVRISGPVAQGARILLGTDSIDGIVVGDGSTSRDRVQIEHLGFGATVTKTAGAAVRFRLSTNSKLENFVITDQFTGISMEACTVAYIQHGRIYDCVVTSGTGILVNGDGNDQHIIDVIMDNDPGAQPAYGLKIERTGAIHVYECDFLRCEYGGYIVPTSTNTIENVWLENNTWDTSGTTGLYIDAGSGATVRRVWIDGDWVATSDDANVIIGGGAGTVDGIDWDGGGLLNAGTHGINIAGGTNIRLRGLLISGNGQDTINTYHGIVVSAAVSGFSFESVRSGQFLGFANQQAYGIAIANASADNFTITGCDLRTNATGAISNAAGINGTTKIIKDALGYATENRGTVSGTTDGSGQITFNPGLAVTPSQIFIHAVSVNFVGAQILSATGSSITIVCLDYAGAAVASASVVFYWSVFA